jgi:hypothetical protein
MNITAFFASALIAISTIFAIATYLALQGSY